MGLLIEQAPDQAAPDGISVTLHAAGISSLVAELADQEAPALAAALERNKLLALGKDYGKFVAEAPSREALSDWVAKYFAGKDLDEVQTMIAVMTDADLAAFHDRAVRDTGKYYSKLADGYFDLAIYACQESVPWNSREGYEEIKKTYRFPWVDDGEVVAFYDLCDSFPHHDRPGFHDPVTSDIPVLATQGLQDTQTDNDAATRVAATLSNAQVVTFAQSGHGVLIFTQCAKDIHVGFHRPSRGEGGCLLRGQDGGEIRDAVT